MSRQCLLVLGCWALGSAIAAQCQDARPPIIESNREIGISFSPSLIAYRECASNGMELDSEHGWIAGAGAKAGFPFRVFGTNWLSEATYQYNNGSSKHSGLNGGGPTVLQYPAHFNSNDVFAGIGPTFNPVPRLSLTPEADVEYRQWKRGLPQAEYEVVENYTFWAPGGGVKAAYNPVGHLVLTGRAGLAHTVFPKNAGIGNASGQVPDVTFSLGTRNVWQTGLGTDYPIGHRIHAFAGIDYSHFGFGFSESESGGPRHPSQREPTSVTDLAKSPCRAGVVLLTWVQPSGRIIRPSKNDLGRNRGALWARQRFYSIPRKNSGSRIRTVHGQTK
jgi:hypothetical protein